MTLGKVKQGLYPSFFKKNFKDLSKTLPRLGLIFPGCQISLLTLSFPGFQNQCSLPSTKIAFLMT